jgi:hypothetical protein
MNGTWSQEYWFAHCPNLACVCYISLFELAMIFLMDVIAWEFLKFLFRKEIPKVKSYFFNRKG